MARSIFITGASGFIGSHFLMTMDTSRYDQVYCLTRNRDYFGRRVPRNGKILPVEADLRDSPVYLPYLMDCDTVVHLAAVTGKVPRKEIYFETNDAGTLELLAASKSAGVRNFLYMSTIAVGYPDKRFYPYALSKEAAEGSVSRSGLNYTILRPTIVVSEESKTWISLMRLVNAPVMPLFDGGQVKIQPILLEDLVRYIHLVLENCIFFNETYDLGGRESLTFKEFLTRAHWISFGRNPRVIRLSGPLALQSLAVLEKVFGNLLPITAGQLSAFIFDGTIRPSLLHDRYSDANKSVDEMLQNVITQQKSKALEEQLNQECRVFTSYLIGQAPDNYVVEKYRQAHSSAKFASRDEDLNAFDRFLLRLARKRPLFTRLVDGYTSLFYKDAQIRRKLILAIAILENSRSTAQYYEAPEAERFLVILWKLALNGVGFIFVFLLANLIILPVRFFLLLRTKSTV